MGMGPSQHRAQRFFDWLREISETCASLGIWRLVARSRGRSRSTPTDSGKRLRGGRAAARYGRSGCRSRGGRAELRYEPMSGGDERQMAGPAVCVRLRPRLGVQLLQ
jgi:hypothetical protein